MGNLGCCGSFKECLTTGICKYGNGKYDEGCSCALYANTIAVSFPLLYVLKQKGLIGIEDNHLTEVGEQYLFKKYWTGTDDVAIVLQSIYRLQQAQPTFRLSPLLIKRVVIQTKKDVGKWLG